MARPSALLHFIVTLLSLLAMFETAEAQFSWDQIMSIISRLNANNAAATTRRTTTTTTTSRRTTTTSVRPTTARTTSITGRQVVTTTMRTTTTPIRTTTTSQRTTTTSRPTTTRSTTRSTTTTSRTTTTSAFPTSGVVPVIGAGNCVNRQKIENMQAGQPDAFNLFILALKAMQEAPSTEDLSWFQLAGIHGAPFTPWEMTSVNSAPVGTYDTSLGYCTHHSVIFTTWHRPYLNLLEQTMVRTAAGIVSKFKGSALATYSTALAQLRFPYWDWSDPNTQSHIPTLATTDTIQVRVADSAGNAVATTIPNPLFAYNFKGTERNTFARPFNGWARTLRNPDSNGNSRNSAADSSMQSGFSTRQRSTLNSFSRATFNAFSNAIENIHDDVHGRVGGGGHMSYVPYSSFDPIFWLHHMNIDRLTAMYQAVKPGLNVAAGSGVSTFARPNANRDDINTPLYPFRKADSTWYTSNDVSTVASMWRSGYGYPEVPCSYQTQSSSTLTSYTNTQINNLYATRSGQKVKRAGSNRYVEWDAKIIVDQSELPGVFIVYIYLGQPEADYNLWPMSGKEVGSLSSLGFPERRKKAMIRSATVPISPTLEDRGLDLSIEETSAYLEKELTWVVLNNGKPVDVSTLKSLKVAITATQITYPEEADKLPVWGKPSYHFNITHKKSGGAKDSTDVEDPKLRDGKKGRPATGLSI